MNFKNKEIRNLVLLSGGVDSAACLMKTMKKEPDITVDVFHLILKNKENRWKEELTAVRKVVRWFKNNNFLNFNYIEVELEYDFSVTDQEIMGLFSSIFATSNTNVFYKSVISGAMDFSDLENLPELKQKKHLWCYLEGQASLRKAFRFTYLEYKNITEGPVEIFPVRTMTKKDIILYLVDNNFPVEITFSCRYPTDVKKLCGECFPCKHRKAIGLFHLFSEPQSGSLLPSNKHYKTI